MKKLLLFFCVISLSAAAQCNLTVSASSTTICDSSCVTLMATANAGCTFSWAPSSSLSSPIVSNPTACPLTTTIYTVTCTCDSGITFCTATITVYVNPPIGITVSTVDASCGQCDGSAIATATGGAGIYTYLWQPNSIPTTQATGLCAGNYTVWVTDANGCTAANGNVQIAQNSNVNGSFVINPAGQPHVYNIIPTVTGGVGPYNFLWMWGDGSTDTTYSPTHTYASAGAYQICMTVTDANGCSNTYCESDTLSRLSSEASIVTANVINNVNGISENSIDNSILIYPNPAKDEFIVKMNASEATLRLFDVQGKMVLEKSITGNTNISLENVDSGVYTISIKSNESISAKKFIVIK